MAQAKNVDENLNLPRCPYSNKLLFDAVTFEGKLYNRVDLLAVKQEASFESAQEETLKVKKLLDSIQDIESKIEPKLSVQPRWEQRITEKGNQSFFII